MPTISTEAFKQIQQRVEDLDRARSDFVDHWKDLRDHILPDHGMGLDGNATSANHMEPEEGRNHYGKIYDSTPVHAALTFGGGMYSGLTPSSFSWFKVGAKGLDREQADDSDVRVYLDDATQEARKAMNEWGLYNAFQHAFLELGVFGTCAIGYFQDDIVGARLEPYTIGEYWLAQGPKGLIDTCMVRRFLTVAQVVNTYGIENVIKTTREMFERGQTEERIEVIHLVEPNDDRIELAALPKVMDRDEQGNPKEVLAKWRSVYYEKSAKAGEVLRLSGHRSFPILAARWNVVGNQTYGVGCGAVALRPSRVLQKIEEDGLVALNKQVRPPLLIDIALSHLAINTQPDGHNYADGVMGSKGGAITSLYNVNVNWQMLEGSKESCRQRIREAFYYDLFASIIQAPTNGRMTATEVEARKQEKMQLLGPALERLQRELLRPAVDLTWEYAYAAGRMPPPPPELEGRSLDVEYVSSLAQAQQFSRMTGLQTFMSFLANAIPLLPELRYKVKLSEAADFVAEVTGTPAYLLTSDEEFNQIVAQAAQAQQQAVQAQQQAVQAKAAADMAKAQLGQNTLLDRTMAAQGIV